MNSTTATTIRDSMTRMGFREVLMPVANPTRLEFSKDFQQGPPGQDWRDNFCMVASALARDNGLNFEGGMLSSPDTPRKSIYIIFQ